MSGQIDSHIRGPEPTTIEKAEAWGDEARRLAVEFRTVGGSDILASAARDTADATDQMVEAFAAIRAGEAKGEDRVWASFSNILKGAAAIYTECAA